MLINNVNQRIDFTTKLKKDHLLNQKERLNARLYFTQKELKKDLVSMGSVQNTLGTA